MKILVTGDEGYLGTTTKQRLKGEGYFVTPFDKKSNFNIRDRADIEKRIIEEGVDVIVHMAAIVGENACNNDIIEAHKTNVEGTRNIIDVCELYDIPLVFISTCSVYGDSGGDDVNPISYYALSKWVSEREIRDRLSNYFILRLGTAYGYSRCMSECALIDKTREGLVINKMTKDAKQKGEITVFGGGQRRPFVSSLSVSKAVSSVVNKFDHRNQKTYDVLEMNLSIEKLAELISEYTGADIRYVDKETDGRDYSRSGIDFREDIIDLDCRLEEEVNDMYKKGF